MKNPSHEILVSAQKIGHRDSPVHAELEQLWDTAADRTLCRSRSAATDRCAQRASDSFFISSILMTPTAASCGSGSPLLAM